MTQTEQLLASLTATAEAALYLGPAGCAPTQYFDWSTRTDNDGVCMEVGDEDGNIAQVAMTRDEMLALQQRLTGWLLATA